MRCLPRIAFLVLLAPSLAAQEIEPAPTFNVPGSVLDLESDEPVAGASVEVLELGRRVYADSLGRFVFAGVPEGRYTFVTKRIGYAEHTQSAEVGRGSATVLRVPLQPVVLEGLTTARNDEEPGRFTLVGFVLDYRTEQPIPGASVEITNLRRHAVTDSAGRFVFPNLSERPYTFETRRIGYAEHEETSRVGEGDVLLVRLWPQPVVLEGITVMADRFERRRRAAGTLSYVSDRPALLSSTASTLSAFLSDRHQISRTSCPSDTGDEMSCLRFRGRAAHPTIYLDDMLMAGGVTVLDVYDPDDIHLVEVYPLLGQIRLYTTHYVESLAITPRTLPPICIVCE